nr:tRNA-splicing endonuclease subunit Sen15-like [Cryptomonas paramecium]
MFFTSFYHQKFFEYKKKKNISQLNLLNINLVFHVFLDLCLFRRWINIRLLYNTSLNFYTIFGFNPKKKKKTLEFFFPIYCDKKIAYNLFDFLITQTLDVVSEKVNIAYIDQNNTIIYYYLVFNFHKISGPFV